MANIEVEWEVEGIISPQESVTKMLQVVATKGKDDSGTFWCWDGRVRSRARALRHFVPLTVSIRHILGELRRPSLLRVAIAVACPSLWAMGGLLRTHFRTRRFQLSVRDIRSTGRIADRPFD